MTVTYPHDRPLPRETHIEEARAEPYVPVYARTRGSTRARKGGVRTWMILAPIGVLVLGGVAAAMIAGSGDEAPAAPLVEPAATAPVLPAQPLISEAAPLETSAAPVVEASPAPAPVVRAAAPAPARRAAPAPARSPAPAVTREAPAEPAGPQPYTSSLNTSPTAAPATPAPTPAPAPVIVIQPQS
jgi:hypothetical protein